MGRPKAGLEWHGSTLLRRAVGILARGTAGPVVVVRAPGQPLPPLPPGVAVVEDRATGEGPLHGLAVGLDALRAAGTRAAVVTATDSPFLTPALVRRLGDLLGQGADAAAARVGGRPEPLVAAYSTALADRAEELLAAGERRAGALLDGLAVRWLEEDALAGLGLDAAALRGLDDMTAYLAARELVPPAVRVVDGAGRTRTVRAASLGAALSATGLRPGAPARLDGAPATDGETPLVDGDVVGCERPFPPR